MRKAANILLIFTFITLGAGTSHADLITFEFSGTVEGVSFDNGTPTEFGVGDTLSGTFTFNSLDSDSNASATHGYYLGSIVSAEILLGSFSASGSSSGNILVIDSTSDTYSAEQISPAGSSVLGQELYDFTLAMTDTTATAFVNDTLPLSPPDIADFGDRTLRLDFADSSFGNFGTVAASLDSFTVTSVPEPTSLALVAIGVPFVLIRRRFRANGILSKNACTPCRADNPSGLETREA